MKITIDGLDTVIKHLNQYTRSLETKKRRFLERLAEIGINQAEISFQRDTGYIGNNDVSVSHTPEWVDKNTLLITASGEAVLFIEFGAGVFQPPYPAPTPPEILPRGTYGKGRGKRRAWGYYDDAKNLAITHGNRPAHAMFDAGQEIRRNIAQIAKEVFGSD